VWHSDPGQNQKLHVIGQEFEICLSCLSIPADKVIPGSALSGYRTKEKASERILLPVKNHVFDILAHSAAETQVMVSGKQALKETQETGVFNQLDAYRFKVVQRAGNRSSFMWDIRNRDLAAAPTSSSLRRQGNVAALL
jgi:hypothetical protein